MSSLRLLALSYLVAASVFVMAATLVAHPQLARAIAGGVQAVTDTVVTPALEQLRRQDVALLDSLDHPPVVRLSMRPLAPGEERLLVHRDTPVSMAPRAIAPSDERLIQPDPAVTLTILPDMSPEAAPVPPEPSIADSRPSDPKLVAPKMPRTAMPQFDIAGIPEPSPSQTPPTTRAQAASLRLRASLTPEMQQNFDLFILVSKSDRGPLGQRMFVYRKDHGALTLLYDWVASTGREKDEVSPRGRKSFTSTPAGFYQLDPDRMYRRYHSYSWDQDMPNAMFFNWTRQGMQTGLAIHSATGDDITRLGQRASAGCVHLSPENAAMLYQLIRDYRGDAPRFAYNADTDTMSNKGLFMHRRDGSLKMADGYRVLIDIEESGGADVVARN